MSIGVKGASRVQACEDVWRWWLEISKFRSRVAECADGIPRSASTNRLDHLYAALGDAIVDPEYSVPVVEYLCFLDRERRRT
jgi:hypothetical protein